MNIGRVIDEDWKKKINIKLSRSKIIIRRKIRIIRGLAIVYVGREFGRLE